MDVEFKTKTIDFYNSNYEFWVHNSRLSIRNEYLSLLGDIYDKRILDVGCGTGIDAELLSQQGAIGIGIDLSLVSIEIAKRKNIKGWGFEIYDSEDYSDNAGFDIVLSSMELMYHHEIKKTLTNYSKLLKVKGCLLIVTNNPFLISQKYRIPYNKQCKYEHVFNEILETSQKCYRSLENIIETSFDCNLKLKKYKELYCKHADCKGFDQSNPNSYPDFICLLFDNHG